MADGKNNILVYRDWIHQFDKLTDEEAGQLIKHFFRYVNDQNPEPPNRIVEICFEPIKQTLKRDLQKWEAKKDVRIETGKLGGIKSGEVRSAKKQSEANEANGSFANKNEANEAVRVSVKDSVNVSVNESVKETPLLAPEILQQSNLFRQPNIPEFSEVRRIFKQFGGTDEMAQKFYDTNESTGWFYKGSPIKNIAPLITSYIQSWQKNEKTNGKFNGKHAKVDGTKVQHDPNDKF